MDDETREMVDQLERELRESVDNLIVGAVETGAALVQVQEQFDAFYRRLNEGPREERLAHLAFVMEQNPEVAAAFAGAEIADVTFAALVELCEDDPTVFRVTVNANARFARTVEQVLVTMTVADPNPEKRRRIGPRRDQSYHGTDCKDGHPIGRCVVVDRECNYSAFNGYQRTPSEWSCVRCLECGTPWRTKAKYVEELRDATPVERVGVYPA